MKILPLILTLAWPCLLFGQTSAKDEKIKKQNLQKLKSKNWNYTFDESSRCRETKTSKHPPAQLLADYPYKTEGKKPSGCTVTVADDRRLGIECINTPLKEELFGYFALEADCTAFVNTLWKNVGSKYGPHEYPYVVTHQGCKPIEDFLSNLTRLSTKSPVDMVRECESKPDGLRMRIVDCKNAFVGSYLDEPFRMAVDFPTCRAFHEDR